VSDAGSDLLSLDLSVAQCRAFYAEELRVVANLTSPALVRAFARVERERFMGAAPWQFASLVSPAKDGGYRTTEDVRDLYHDVFVALKREKALNNGLPSTLAGCIGKLDLAAGQRVFHVGCGSGYYTAIMAEVVGPEGSVVAVEVDSDLAALAAENLKGYPQVRVVAGDGTAVVPPESDAVFINAGVTHPQAGWTERLAEGGRMLLPLCVGVPENPGKVLAVQITRRGEGFAADPYSIFGLYSSPSLRDPARQALLHAGLHSKRMAGLRSVRLEEHAEEESCIAHAAGFCLSAAAVGEV
jgi:protein-L-isoaspartate(D-aspartate) O-methyltransferase